MTWQVNDELVKEINTFFVSRNDLINRWGNLISSYTALPGLRFFAPMSMVGASGQAVDIALGNSLANNNNADFNYQNLVPYCTYNGTNQYHNIADNAAHDIIGNEAYIDPAIQGLTIMQWVMPLSLPGAITRIFSKGTTTGNARAYAMTQQAGNVFAWVVSSNGTATFAATDDTAFSADTWYFVAGRYDPGAELKLWVGTPTTELREFTNVTSIPATLNNSATGLAIGAQADGTQFSNIRASMNALYVVTHSDSQIKAIFEQGKLLYRSS